MGFCSHEAHHVKSIEVRCSHLGMLESTTRGLSNPGVSFSSFCSVPDYVWLELIELRKCRRNVSRCLQHMGDDDLTSGGKTHGGFEETVTMCSSCDRVERDVN